MWLLFAVGLAIAFRILYPVLKAQRDPASKALVLEFGVRPSGPDGTWTRRDRIVSGFLSLLTAAVCLGIVVLAERVSEHAMNLSTTSYIATGVMIVFVMFTLLALISGVIDLVRAPFTKSESHHE